MKFIQQNDVSMITLDEPFTAKLSGELSRVFNYIGGHNPQKIVLNLQSMPYINSAGLNALFQLYMPLYEKKFNLEIQEASADVAEILRLANFHLISKINPNNGKEKMPAASLS